MLYKLTRLGDLVEYFAKPGLEGLLHRPVLVVLLVEVEPVRADVQVDEHV